MIRNKLFAAVGVALLGAGLMSVPALAKCTKACHKQFNSELKSCKTACPKGKTGKDCRKACRDARKASVTKCKAATSPACSPSGAFLDDLSGF
jgi:hypothetical protein